MPNKQFIFFGTPSLAVTALETLITEGLTPTLVVTSPDRPAGRGMHMRASPVKEFCITHNIAIETPEKITAEFIETVKEKGAWDFFIVAAYGKILPKALLELPKHGTINIHPSLLPQYRGAAPLESVLLSNDTETGVSVMLIDELVDHGPLIAVESFPLLETETIETLLHKSAVIGAELIAKNIEPLINGTLVLTPQDHAAATHTKKISKEAGLVNLAEDPWELWKKYRALHVRPGIYFYTEKNSNRIRVKIKTARWEHEQFIIETVIPENGKPIPFSTL